MGDANITQSIFYSCIIFVLTVLACCSQTKIKYSSSSSIAYRRNKKMPFVCSCIGACFFVAFTSAGVDRATYGNLFLNIQWATIFDGWQEPGFNLFMLIIKVFTKEPVVFLAIFASITVILTYWAIWKYRKNLSVGFAVFIYLSQFYLQSINLMRIYFAMSILLCGSSILFHEKPWRYIIVIFIAFSIHYMAIITIVPYLVYMMLRHKNNFKNIRNLLFVSLFIACMVILGCLFLSANHTLLNNTIINKFASYFDEFVFNGIGYRWIIECIPYVVGICLSVYFWRRKSIYFDKRLYYIIISFFGVSMAINIISYMLPVIGRSNIVLNLPLVIVLPILIETLYKEIKCYRFIAAKTNNSIALREQILVFLLCCYLIGAYVLYLSEYLIIDGILDYNFIWNNYLW